MGPKIKQNPKMSTSVAILTSLCQAFAVDVRIIPCIAILYLPKSQNDHQQIGDHFDPFDTKQSSEDFSPHQTPFIH